MDNVNPKGVIGIKGARENNLKNIDLAIPRNKVVCFVGVSGSGKSTVAFDIVAREGQRQYFESLPSFARRYLHTSGAPDVDEISGMSASVVISQDRVFASSRSTVGTLTEVFTYLRLLYSRAALPAMDSSNYSFNHPDGACPTCKGLGRRVEVDPKKVLDFDKSLNEGAVKVSEWKVGGRMWTIVKATGYFDMDKKIKDFGDHELDKLLYAKKELLENFDGIMVNKWTFQGIIARMVGRNTKVHRGLSMTDMAYTSTHDCGDCGGSRLKKQALAVTINGKNIGEVAAMALPDALAFVKKVKIPTAQPILPGLVAGLSNLIEVGVGYLTLNRSTDTLSGGEAQRVKMARQMGCNLIETIYVLDEPTAGLHARDVEKVIVNLRKLCNLGNSVLVVEHDASVIKGSDFIIELGPGGGKEGGEVIFAGDINAFLKSPTSLTAKYLKAKVRPTLREPRKAKEWLSVKNATRNNLKGIDVEVPKGVLVALTGVSGSGKSSLVEEIVAKHQVTLVDQRRVGNNKRGCIATYVGVFDVVRKVFAQKYGMSESLFSYNSKGACDECGGLGFLDVEMHFLGDVKIKCDKCKGKRYKEKVLRYEIGGKNIAEVLEMTVAQAFGFFEEKEVRDNLALLVEVGLDYIELGQGLDMLSGGESQRLKLASNLFTKGEFYILDEPTTGLHFADIAKLMKLLNRLVDAGNTVLVVEHNLEVIAQADWVIDLGPEGGKGGGYVVAQGTPKHIMGNKKSWTGQYLSQAV